MTALLVALGAAVGAPLRYVLAQALDGRFPTGLLVVNVLGSGLFGAFAALSLDDAGWALLGTGFCGGFTSFSTFAVQSVELTGAHRDGVRRGDGRAVRRRLCCRLGPRQRVVG